jgi:hypothetical protein
LARVAELVAFQVPGDSCLCSWRSIWEDAQKDGEAG